MKKMCCESLSMWLLVISGLIWGIVGVFDFNLVMYLVGPSWAMHVIYVIFGIAALCAFFNWRKIYKGK